MEYKPLILKPHQVTALNHLRDNPRAVLNLGMSLLKTVTTLLYLYEMHYAECAITKTLVVAPDKVARITWPEEIKKWREIGDLRYSLISGDAAARDKALAQDAEVYIIGVDNLAWLLSKWVYKKGRKWVGKIPFDCVVLDELSLFKSRGSARFKLLDRAIKTVEYRVGLTGTFTPNGYTDAWSQMKLIDGGARLGDKWGAFVDKYFKVRGNGMIVYEYKPKPGAARVIAAKLADIVLSMQTRDYLELPELVLDDVEINLKPFDREIYDDLERDYVLDFLSGGETTVKTAADLTNKLLQVSSGAIYKDRDDPNAAREWVELNRAKLETLHQLIEDQPKENFIVVYQYRHEVERIKRDFPYARELRKGKKLAEDFADWNAGRIRLLLIHPAGAGHGLNLQFGGSHMVWFSLTWNLEHWEQAVARLLRLGALKRIFVHRLIVKGTRDVKVKRRVENKGSDQKFLMDEIKELKLKHYGDLR